MRWIACLAFVLACHSSSSTHGDGGTGIDSAPSCMPSGTCATGPMCGLTCCGTGERCVQGACMCGGGPACDTAHTNNTCQSAGPSMGENSCGAICCGGTGPCPLR